MLSRKKMFLAGSFMLIVGGGLAALHSVIAESPDYQTIQSFKSQAAEQEKIVEGLDAQVAAYWSAITAANQRLNRPVSGSPQGYCQSLPPPGNELLGSEFETALNKELCTALYAKDQSEQRLTALRTQLQDAQVRYYGFPPDRGIIESLGGSAAFFAGSVGMQFCLRPLSYKAEHRRESRISPREPV